MDIKTKHEIELEELKAKHAAEERNSENSNTIKLILEDAGVQQPRFIHWHSNEGLYGVQCSLSFGDKHSHEVLKDADCREIVKGIPPVGKAYAHGRYHYFAPLHLGESAIDEKDTLELYHEVCPFHVALDNWGVVIRYFTIIDEFVCEVSLHVSGSSMFKHLHFTGNYSYHGRNGDGPIRAITDRSVTIGKDNLSYVTRNITRPDGVVCGEFAPPIIYAQGSSESLGNAKLWAHLIPGSPCSITAFLNAFNVVEKEAEPDQPNAWGQTPATA